MAENGWSITISDPLPMIVKTVSETRTYCRLFTVLRWLSSEPSAQNLPEFTMTSQHGWVRKKRVGKAEDFFAAASQFAWLMPSCTSDLAGPGCCGPHQFIPTLCRRNGKGCSNSCKRPWACRPRGRSVRHDRQSPERSQAIRARSLTAGRI